jgi:hypothetical protein
MTEPYVILNNYNYALNEDFDYLDDFVPQWSNEEKPKDEADCLKSDTDQTLPDTEKS